MKVTKTLSLFAALTMTGTTFAQNCHGGVEERDAHLAYSGEVDCNAGISGSIGIGTARITIQDREVCPHALTITPRHDRPIRKENSGFVVRHQSSLTVKVVLFECNDYGFLFFTSHHCEVDRVYDAGVVEHYRLYACNDAPKNGTPE